MSDDSGIYIGRFKNGYKVIHTQAIENIEDEQSLNDFFGNAPLLATADEAFEEADRIEDRLIADFCEPEYGITLLSFKDVEWKNGENK